MDAYEFIEEEIDSVPHLEALMLLWNSRPVAWTCEELGTRLYLPSEQVGALLRELVRAQLIRELQTEPSKYSYFSRSEEHDELMRQVDSIHRRDLVRISTMIHAKASRSVREFARAFLLKKDDQK